MDRKEFIVKCLRFKISTEGERARTTNIKIPIPSKIDDIERFIEDSANEIYRNFLGDKTRIGVEEAFFMELKTYIVQLLFVSCIFNDFSIIQNNLGIVKNTYRDGNIEKHRYFCSNLLNIESPSELRVENCDDILETIEKNYPKILKPYIDRIYMARVKREIIMDSSDIGKRLKEISELHSSKEGNGTVGQTTNEYIGISEKKLEFGSTCPKGINPRNGLKEEELQAFLRYIASETRNGICNEFYGGNKEFFEKSSLAGKCGSGQKISAEILKNYGLNPILSNNRCFPFGNDFASHNFVTVCINVEGRDRFFLIDTTYKQFCRVINGKDRLIKDGEDEFSQSPGYMLSLLPGGDELLHQLNYDGFFELTEENAKLYFDAFFLSCNGNFEGKPKDSELETGITGNMYIQLLLSPRTIHTDEMRDSRNNGGNGIER